MPTYDYRREDSGQVFEIQHRMSVTITNWGELCGIGNIDPGEIAAETPVTKVLRTGGVVKSSALSNPDTPPCMSGGGCGGGNCGL